LKARARQLWPELKNTKKLAKINWWISSTNQSYRWFAYRYQWHRLWSRTRQRYSGRPSVRI
jgi:hypothetical protein